jgi:hypothetical protein
MGINAHFSYYVPFDKAIQYDGLFYGDGAYPVSDEYPRELQRKIYVMTEKMRPHIELRVPLAVYLKRKLGNLLQE